MNSGQITTINANDPPEKLAFAVMAADPGATITVTSEEMLKLGESTARKTGRRDLKFEVASR